MDPMDSVELKIEVFDYDFGSSDDFLGEIKYTLHALQASSYTVQPNIVTSELQSRTGTPLSTSRHQLLYDKPENFI